MDKATVAASAESRMKPGPLLALAAVLILALSLVMSLIGAAPAEAHPRPAAGPAPAVSAAPCHVGGPTIKWGSQGPHVVELKRCLQRAGFATMNQSDQFDEALFHAIVAFQKVFGLGVDGVAGPATKGRLAQGTSVTMPAHCFNGSKGVWASACNDITGKRVSYLNTDSLGLKIISISAGSGRPYEMKRKRADGTVYTLKNADGTVKMGDGNTPLGWATACRNINGPRYSAYTGEGAPLIDPWYLDFPGDDLSCAESGVAMHGYKKVPHTHNDSTLCVRVPIPMTSLVNGRTLDRGDQVFNF